MGQNQSKDDTAQNYPILHVVQEVHMVIEIVICTYCV